MAVWPRKEFICLYQQKKNNCMPVLSIMCTMVPSMPMRTILRLKLPTSATSLQPPLPNVQKNGLAWVHVSCILRATVLVFEDRIEKVCKVFNRKMDWNDSKRQALSCLYSCRRIELAVGFRDGAYGNLIAYAGKNYRLSDASWRTPPLCQKPMGDFIDVVAVYAPAADYRR